MPPSEVTCDSPRSPCKNSSTLAALVSMMDSIISLPALFNRKPRHQSRLVHSRSSEDFQSLAELTMRTGESSTCIRQYPPGRPVASLCLIAKVHLRPARDGSTLTKTTFIDQIIHILKHS